MNEFFFLNNIINFQRIKNQLLQLSGFDENIENYFKIALKPKWRLPRYVGTLYKAFF